VNTVDGEPTHDWKRIKSIDEAQMKAREARAAQRPPKNRKPVRVSTPTSVRVSRTENGDFPVRVSRTTAVGETRTTSDVGCFRSRCQASVCSWRFSLGCT
jgi:hypothetical protein